MACGELRKTPGRIASRRTRRVAESAPLLDLLCNHNAFGAVPVTLVACLHTNQTVFDRFATLLLISLVFLVSARQARRRTWQASSVTLPTPVSTIEVCSTVHNEDNCSRFLVLHAVMPTFISLATQTASSRSKSSRQYHRKSSRTSDDV